MGTTILSVSFLLYVRAYCDQKINVKISSIVELEAIYSRPGDMRSQRYLPPLSLTHLLSNMGLYGRVRELGL